MQGSCEGRSVAYAAIECVVGSFCKGQRDDSVCKRLKCGVARERKRARGRRADRQMRTENAEWSFSETDLGPERPDCARACDEQPAGMQAMALSLAELVSLNKPKDCSKVKINYSTGDDFWTQPASHMPDTTPYSLTWNPLILSQF
uniref:Uncharacterized protein n=1 Tax=Physcomitrium patens TaxID=3218 RepID=A0A2K1IJ50_PHYPA|nr:hypothetical protein PHYPA_027991 [Physcomitrium patens]